MKTLNYSLGSDVHKAIPVCPKLRRTWPNWDSCRKDNRVTEHVDLPNRYIYWMVFQMCEGLVQYFNLRRVIDLFLLFKAYYWTTTWLDRIELHS